MTRAISDLSVLLGAGLSLNRALDVVADSIARPRVREVFRAINLRVTEGASLSRTLLEAPPELFPASAAAMAEAGEASGKLDVSLRRLADSLERAEALRETVVSSLIYPMVLVGVGAGVVGVMLFVVVPQFETLLASANGRELPQSTMILLGVSRFVREFGLLVLIALVGAVVAAWRWVRAPAAKARVDRRLLRVPVIGMIIRQAQTAQFARVLGSLIEGGVAVPAAVAIARRSVTNAHMGAAIETVAVGLKQGGGLTGPLAATGVFPPIAVSFLRTGEETAQLGSMLDRLADVMDGAVRTSISRALGILTPALTVVIGGFVALVIASLMTAILGFNELALGPQ